MRKPGVDHRAALLVAALLLTGCAETDQAAAPSPAPSPTSAAPSPSASPLPETSRCENPVQRYALSYPYEWSMGGGPGVEPCRFFDETPIAALEPGTEVVGLAVRATVRDVPLEQARRDQPGEQEDQPAAGLPAVRASGTVQDDALLPPGTRYVTWLVDLGGRTLLLTADDSGEGDFAAAVAVLDEMAQTVEPL